MGNRSKVGPDANNNEEEKNNNAPTPSHRGSISSERSTGRRGSGLNFTPRGSISKNNSSNRKTWYLDAQKSNATMTNILMNTLEGCNQITLEFNQPEDERRYQFFYLDKHFFKLRATMTSTTVLLLLLHWSIIYGLLTTGPNLSVLSIISSGMQGGGAYVLPAIPSSPLIPVAIICSLLFILPTLASYYVTRPHGTRYFIALICCVQGAIGLALIETIVVHQGLGGEIYSTLNSHLGGSEKAAAILEVAYKENIEILASYMILTLCLLACLFHVQVKHFMFLCTECVLILSIASTTLHVREIENIEISANSLWVFPFRLVFVSCALCYGVHYSETSYRREFLRYKTLSETNRRLTHQNIHMREQLTIKLSSQNSYEMEGVLRVLVQLKKGLDAGQASEIDKIITSLVSSQDLFKVNIEQVLGGESDSEVTGWLSVLDEKAVDEKNRTNTACQRRSQRVSVPFDVSIDKFLASLFRKTSSTNIIAPSTTDSNGRVEWLNQKTQGEFHIDLFELERECSRPLVAAIVACLGSNDMFTCMNLVDARITAFAKEVEKFYSPVNAYHKPLHAASVVFDMCYHMLHLKHRVPDIEFFSGIIAAGVHDVAHPGVSNRFLINSCSKLAITYSDDSVLERMHLAEAFRIIGSPKCDIFENFAPEDKLESRKLIIRMVLATDLAQHFQHVTKLKSKEFAVTENSKQVESDIVLVTLIMLADLGHAAKPFDYHKEWAALVSEEFFRQGDLEIAQNLPISPLCDRNNTNIPKSQVGFFNFIAVPLFDAANLVIPMNDFNRINVAVKANRDRWQALADSEKEE